MANILSFFDVANILGVHIKMETSKEKVINVHIKDIKIVHFKACAEGLLYANINDPTIITNTNNFSLHTYSYLSTVFFIVFFTDSEIKGAQKFRKLQ